MELILGMPPMSQYDAAAEPMWRCFNNKVNTTPFKSILPNINLDDKNEKNDELSKLSSGLDFSKEDKVPEILFNQILWKAIKGIHSEMPAPRRSAFLKPLD
jgi:hypothetical protein